MAQGRCASHFGYGGSRNVHGTRMGLSSGGHRATPQGLMWWKETLFHGHVGEELERIVSAFKLWEYEKSPGDLALQGQGRHHDSGSWNNP